MILPPCACNLHEVACPQPAGVGQDAAGHGDFLIPCEVLDYLEWRAVDRRQPRAEFRSRPTFNAGDKNAQHIVEDLDLILAKALRVMRFLQRLRVRQ